MRIDEVLRDAARRLQQRADGDPASARVDAEALLCDLLQRPRAWLFAWPETHLDNETLTRYEERIARRLAGAPVAHLTGRREFWSLEIEVDETTLIPRPETELLVEQALNLLRDTARPTILEAGTGSGCVACALAQERADATLVASDISAGALAIAARNVARHAPRQVRLVRSDWLAAFGGRFDLILSNPPYIAADDPHLDRGDLPAEPRAALLSGVDGLDAIRRLVADAPALLGKNGWLLFEHGHDQGPAARALLARRGYREVATARDLSGIERVSRGRAPAPGVTHEDSSSTIARSASNGSGAAVIGRPTTRCEAPAASASRGVITRF